MTAVWEVALKAMAVDERRPPAERQVARSAIAEIADLRTKLRHDIADVALGAASRLGLLDEGVRTEDEALARVAGAGTDHRDPAGRRPDDLRDDAQDSNVRIYLGEGPD